MPNTISGTVTLGGQGYDFAADLLAIAPPPPPPGADHPPYTVSPIGFQTWGYNWSQIVVHPHASLQGIPVPHAITAAGAWDALAASCELLGPVESTLTRLIPKVQNLLAVQRPITCCAYGPEGTEGVPAEESDPANLLAYCQQAVSLAADHGLTLVYGGATELLCDPATWQWGVHYDLLPDLIHSLAAALRPNDVFFIRPFQIQMIYEQAPDGARGQAPAGFRTAIADLIATIRQGNPLLRIWAQLLCSPHHAGDDFLQSRLAIWDLLGEGGGTYMELPGDNQSEYHAGALAAMAHIFEVTAP